MDGLQLAFVTYCAQLLLVIGVAAAAAALGRVTDPQLRFTYWRGVALACLVLPFSALLAPVGDGVGLIFAVASVQGGDTSPVRPVFSASARMTWWLVCAGAVARLGWLAAGAIRLRGVTRRSRAAILPPDLEAIRRGLAPGASFRISHEVVQPAAFGLRHPLVLVPERFFDMEPAAQRTVACHELLHVARRDWPCIVLEEMVRAVFWFHPAVWWLVEQIQESREQVVDRLVIARIPSKRAYMAALLAFADRGNRSEVLATAFLRRRHLRSRLRTLAKESLMSRKRLQWTAVALACVMAGAVAGTVAALPLGPAIGEASGPQQVVEGTEAGVTLPKVVSEVKPTYTPEALQAKIEGMILMTTVVRTDGTPGDIKVTQSLDTKYGLDKQAIAALGQWRFEPGRKGGKPVPVRVDVEMRFSLKK